MSTGNSATLLTAVSEISLHRLGAPEEQVHHVVGLVVERGRLAPGALLAAPVRELGRDDRVDVGAELRVAQELDRVGRVEDLLQVRRGHVLLLSGSTAESLSRARECQLHFNC